MKELACSQDQLHTTQRLLCARGCVGHVKQWFLLPAICTRVFLVLIVMGKVVCNFQQHITTNRTQNSLTGVLTYNGCSLGQECWESRTAAAVARTESRTAAAVARTESRTAAVVARTESRIAAAVAQTELSGVKYFTSTSTAHNKTRQTGFIVSHQPLTQFACGRVLIIYYSLLAYCIYIWQIYDTTAIKSGCVIAWKAIMTVEVAGLRGSGRWCESVCLA